MGSRHEALNWLPQATGRVCFTIDDVHPGNLPMLRAGGTWTAAHSASGVAARRHPQLRTTLSSPPTGGRSAWPSPPFLAKLPYIAIAYFSVASWPEGTMRLDRHPEFVTYLKSLPALTCAPRPVSHRKGRTSHRVSGPLPRGVTAMLAEAIDIFHRQICPMHRALPSLLTFSSDLGEPCGKRSGIHSIGARYPHRHHS